MLLPGMYSSAPAPKCQMIPTIMPPRNIAGTPMKLCTMPMAHPEMPWPEVQPAANLAPNNIRNPPRKAETASTPGALPTPLMLFSHKYAATTAKPQ